jgi:CxxC-x17-CxxC domain-containing protein
MDFVDRLLICADSRQQFIFTAGEQLFFLDKQFKNDPKRCKPCKARRAGMVAAGAGPAAAGLSRTETRTMCSECGVETTVPFKPTQGRPVLCRQCFQAKRPAATAPDALPAIAPPTEAAAPPVTSQVTAEMIASTPQAVVEQPSAAPDLVAAAIEVNSLANSN